MQTFDLELEQNLRQFVAFMQERQRIYLKRQAGEPRPWTDNSILQKYRFTNIYREQDRETIALRKWLGPFADHPNLPFACTMFRQIGLSGTLAELGFPRNWEPERVRTILENRMKRGEKTFTSAYQRPAHGGKDGPDIAVRALDGVWQAIASGADLPPWQSGNGVSLQQSHRWLTKFFGWGGFLSYYKPVNNVAVYDRRSGP